MKKRIKNAAEQYDERFGESERGQFYVSDYYEIEEETGLNAWNSISMALKAGFMIGYRCKAREERKKVKRKRAIKQENNNGKSDSNQDSPTSKNNLQNNSNTKTEAHSSQQAIEGNSQQLEYLAWDLGALKHNLCALDPVFDLLCFDLKKLNSDELKALIYCARDTLDQASVDLSDGAQSTVKRFNNLFPDLLEE